MTENLDYDLLNEQVEKSLKRRKSIMRWVFFGVNAVMFVVFTLIMWMMAFSNPTLRDMAALEDSPIIGILILATMGWLTGLIFQGLTALSDSGLMDRQMRKEVISKELGSLILDQALQAKQEKAKRQLEEDELVEEEQEVTISDDGELVPVKRRK